MAIDLRFILSVIRINADLERVGDQAVNIAVRVREMGPPSPTLTCPSTFPKLASLCQPPWSARRCRPSSTRRRRRSPSSVLLHGR